MVKKVLLGAEYSILDPLGLFYLSTIAKEEGWEPKIVLGKRPNYKEIDFAIKEFQPDMLGFTLYTGNHINVGQYLQKIKEKNKNLITVIGGPHPTYFPKDSMKYADFVVVGEGFNSFRKILRKDVGEGIVHLTQTEEFPLPNRESFYKENPEHNSNPIKNVITSVGCFFNCTHCYNSCKIRDVEGFNKQQIRDMENALSSKRFFPYTKRTVEEVIKEIDFLQKISPSTKMLFLEDDIFGIDLEWLRKFADKYDRKLPFHINMRFEFIDPKKQKGRERLRLLKKAGCTGLSLGIESGNEVIRKEILKRNTPEDLIFRTMKYLGENNFKVRTYQMLGLPYGITTTPTKINLEADLETLEFNVKLKESTGLPTIAWASTLAPYPGTEIANYCSKYGFYKGTLEDMIGDETYRIKSVLKHLKKWVGPSSSINEDYWLNTEEQEKYRIQLNLLMNYFPLFANIKKGHEFARNFLNGEDLSSAGINKSIRNHIYDYELFGVK